MALVEASLTILGGGGGGGGGDAIDASPVPFAPLRSPATAPTDMVLAEAPRGIDPAHLTRTGRRDGIAPVRA